MKRIISKSHFSTKLAASTKPIQASQFKEDKKTSYYSSIKQRKTVELTKNLLRTYNLNTPLFELGCKYLSQEIEEKEYYQQIREGLNKKTDISIPDLYITLFNTNIVNNKSLQDSISTDPILDICQELYCSKRVSKFDLFVLNQGLAKFLINTRFLNNEPFITLEQEYPDLFKAIDDKFFDTIQGLPKFEDQFFMAQNMSKANMLNQHLYMRLNVHFFNTSIYKLQLFDCLRVYGIFTKSKSFCTLEDFYYRKQFVSRFIKDFKTINAFHASKILFAQLSFEQKVLETDQVVKLERLAVKMEKNHFSLDKIDNNTLRQIHLAFQVFEEQINLQQYEHLTKFIQSLKLKCKEGVYVDSEKQQQKVISDTQKECSRLIGDAFRGAPDFYIEREKPCCIYAIDLYLNIPSLKLHNLAIEISNFKSKNFRLEYENPSDRLRKQILKKHGYNLVEIDTLSIPNYENLSDFDKSQIIKNLLLKHTSNENMAKKPTNCCD